MNNFWEIYGFLLLLSIIGAQAAVSQAKPASPAALVFTNPGSSDIILSELDEFATVVMGNPWDMNEATDLSYYRGVSNLSNSAFANGVYAAQMNGDANDGAERITLLDAGAPNHTALRIGKIGYQFPIDANRYRYLTYRLYKSNVEQNSGVIRWYEDDTRTSSVMGVSSSFVVPAGTGWHTIVVDLATAGLQAGGKSWSDTVRELIIHPFAGPGAANATVKLDWARLTAEDPRTARPFTIQWTNGSGQINLYASPGDKSLDTANDILIATGVNANDGAYIFQTGILPAGKYYIAAVAGSDVIWSDSALIVNTPPQIEITKPSMESGQEYAQTVIGDEWDMSDPQDINYNLQPWENPCVANQTFLGGVYSANLYQCPAGRSVYVDPILYIGGMNPYAPGIQDPVIDAGKYRYFSFRFYHSGTQNVLEGWVARFGWWTVDSTDGQVIEDVVMSRDVILLEGWNTYRIDLWANDIVDESHSVQRPWLNSSPNRLRLDPSELNSSLLPVTVQLDWIKLTAVETVTQGEIFPISYNAKSSYPGTATFYYDLDTSPLNGKTFIDTRNTAAAANNWFTNDAKTNPNQQSVAATHQIYLPAVLNNYCNNCVYWDTSAVSPGTYYICAEIDDSYNSTYRCSEAPVIVNSP